MKTINTRTFWNILGIALVFSQLLSIAGPLGTTAVEASGPTEPPTSFPAHPTLTELGSGDEDPPDLPPVSWIRLEAWPCILGIMYNYDPTVDIYVSQDQGQSWWVAEEDFLIGRTRVWYKFDLRNYDEYNPTTDSSVAVVTNDRYRNNITVPACKELCSEVGNWELVETGEWTWDETKEDFFRVLKYEQYDLYSTSHLCNTKEETEWQKYSLCDEVGNWELVETGEWTWDETKEDFFRVLKYEQYDLYSTSHLCNTKEETEEKGCVVGADWYRITATVEDPPRFSWIDTDDGNRSVFAAYVGEQITVTATITNWNSGGWLPTGRRVSPEAQRVLLSYTVRWQVDRGWEEVETNILRARLVSRDQSFSSSRAVVLEKVAPWGEDAGQLSLAFDKPGLYSTDWKVTFWDRANHEVRGNDASVMILVKAQAGKEITTHTVRPDECLSVIAKHYGTTVQAITKANGISNPDLILVDQVLEIPTA